MLDEKNRVEGYCRCTRCGHQIEDEYTKKIQIGITQRRLREEEESRYQSEQARLRLEKVSLERKNLHRKKLEELESLDDIDPTTYISFRVINPYEGDDKKNFASHPIDKHDTIPFYKRMDQLEDELSPSLIYCRGERNPEHKLIRDITDSFGVMLIKPELVDYIKEIIASIYIGSGTIRKHFCIEPFIPSSNTYLSRKIKMEKNKKIIRENRRFDTDINN